MKKQVIRVLLVLILIADMAFIFANSAQNSAASSNASQGVTEIVAPVIVPNYKEMDETEKKQAVLTLDGIVREAAHLLQFTPMGFSLYLFLCTLELPRRLRHGRIPITIGFGLLYAISDELHQLLSPGRAFQLFDVFMDVCGVVIGCIGGIVIISIIKFISNSKTTSSTTTSSQNT